MSTASSQLKVFAERLTATKDWARYRLIRDQLLTMDKTAATEHEPAWTCDILEEFLAQSWVGVRAACLDRAGPLKVVGWIAYSWDSVWHLEIHRIAVRPDYQLQGIGRWLVDCATATAHENIFAEVQERDLRTQLFLRACGFRCTHILEGLEEDGGDAYLFTKIKS